MRPLKDSPQRVRSLFALVLAFVTSLLLIGAPSVAGFGFVTKWRIRGTPPIAAHGDAVYVGAANVHSQWLQRYTTRGSLVTQWRLPGQDRTSMHVMGIATDDRGNVYALAANHARTENQVMKYTDRGRLLDRWEVGKGPTARGIAVDAAGNVYVAITADDRVEAYGPTGRLLRRFETPAPSAIAADRGGDLYVAGLTGVSVYRDDGTFVRAWKSGAGPNSPEPGVGGLEVPTAIAVDRAGRVLVADGGRNERDVKVFTPEGALVGRIGGPGRGNGRFRYSPNELAIDGRGSVYVASLKTIQKFGEPSSAFSLAGVRQNRRTGSARLIADVPGVGKLKVEGRGIRSTRRRASLAGEVSLAIVPNLESMSKLRRGGQAVVAVKVTYTPTTAGRAHPATRSTRITLVRAR